MIIFLISILLAILLEANVTTLPLVLLIILFATVVLKQKEMFAVAFFAGLMLDLLSFHVVGFSSIYFTVMVLVVFLYRRKFEIESLSFITIFSFLSALVYLFLEGSSYIVIQSLIGSIVMILSFLYYKHVNKKLPQYI
jgi:rod shape-determining protein MreD